MSTTDESLNLAVNVVFDDSIIDSALGVPESYLFDCKRLKDKLTSVLEAIVAFANSDGGTIALGLEDPDKGKGRDRVYGIEENASNVDELRRLIGSRITDSSELNCEWKYVGCTLRDGRRGTVVFLVIPKSNRVHSLVDGGTYVRIDHGNRQLSANEITSLCFARGTVSAETQLEAVDFDLLDTVYWKQYALRRQLTRTLPEALRHIGLARADSLGKVMPTRAAVLLFAEDPGGLLAAKAAIRIFHYRGISIEPDPNTNLLKPPKTIGGPLVRQIREATDAVVDELASGIQMGPLGFEVIQRYPLRVVREAITNAVVHRDYRLPADVIIRIFADRIDVESPGLLGGPVTVQNVSRIGTYARNPVIVSHLREFPHPPNLDAGEGVPMMFKTMRAGGLYPPVYKTRPLIEREAVTVSLLNNNRPTAWEQVSRFIDINGQIENRHVRRLLNTDDVLRVSKQLREWVEKGLLVVVNPHEGTRLRRYSKPGTPSLRGLFSGVKGKQKSK